MIKVSSDDTFPRDIKWNDVKPGEVFRTFDGHIYIAFERERRDALGRLRAFCLTKNCHESPSLHTSGRLVNLDIKWSFLT